MRIKVADTTQKIAFVAYDSTDHISRKTGLSSFTVYYSRNGGAAAAMTTPTVAELDASNMEGDYILTVDEAGMVSAKGELVMHISAAGMDDVTLAVEIVDNFEKDVLDAVNALNDLSAAQVNTEVDIALADYDAPTKAELDSGFAALNDLSAAEVNAEVDTALSDYDAPTKAELDSGFAALNNISTAEVNAEVDTALADIHLDHLLAVDTGASLPGVAGSILQDLLEDDAGTWRYNINALETAPSGTGASAEAIADAVWDELKAGHVISGSFGETNQIGVPSATLGDYKADISTLETRLSAARAGYLDNLNGHTPQTGNSYARLGDPAGASIAADLLTIDNLVDDLESRVSAVRAGYLDELAAANIPSDIDTLLSRITAAVALASVCTEARLSELDAANLPTDVATVDTVVDAIKAKTDNLPSGIAKNVELANFQVLMVLSSDHVTAATGKTVTGQISKDGGAFDAVTNSISEIGNGMYKVTLTATEMNSDVITLKFTETDCDQRTITVYTT